MLNKIVSDALTLGLTTALSGNVFNHDFASYRTLTGRGGDFVIYSDIHWETISRTLELS